MRLVLLLSFIVTSCMPVPVWRWNIMQSPPGDKSKYNPIFVSGWQDGCKSGMATAAPNIYQLWTKYKRDPIKSSNKIYVNGWNYAYRYCMRYASSNMKQNQYQMMNKGSFLGM